MVRLILLALIWALVPVEAHATPVFVALVANGVSWGAAAWATFGGAALRILGSVLLNVGVAKLMQRKVAGQEVMRDLAQPTSLPAYRFVYGDTWAMGTPAGWVVRGQLHIGCWILNSRPSEGPFEVLLDKRRLLTTGDPYDFSSDGAVATNAPFFDGAPWVRYWIGRGDQTTCPDLVQDWSDGYFVPTDAWTGRTVIWVIADVGPNETRSERWPAAPPEVMASGRWSRVWDPRDPAQIADDPATWAWSANQALCALDALRSNPVRPYANTHLWLDTWIWAADVADERVPVRGGGTIPRYEVNGTLAFSSGAEIEDQLEPLMIAGAARLVRARGQLGIIPGCPQDSAMTLTDMLDGEAPTLTRYADRDSLATSVTGKYLAPDRCYEETDLPTYVLAGAQEADGGLDQPYQPDLSMITDHRQGQRVQKILLMRKRMQRTIRAEFPPAAFDLVAGSWCETDFASPFGAWGGLWEVEGIQPVLIPAEGDGVALRCTISLRETTPAIYAWDAETDEVEVEEYDFDATVTGVQPPTGVAVDMSQANDLTSSGAVVPRFRADFTASVSGSVTGYEWQIRLDGDDWPAESASVTAPDESAITIYGGILSQTALQDFRIRAVGSRGASGWVVVPGLARGFAFSAITATAGAAEATFSGPAPTNAAFAGARIYRGAVGLPFSSATQIAQFVGLVPGAALTLTVTGLSAGAADYWAVPLTASLAEGSPSGPHTLTIT
ncbi:phage tail protein [Rhodobacter capsulatus]|uniref:phage tail protein n=1 Tax=Rhodobacter capsulatus TaxID=1061 RepID=UPI0003D2BA4C|nr:phage tail protein [Rhodobacter capsulatus]ETD89947.1 hypothetical protein U713_07505 [Rhodobacter capsulatus YW2]